MRFDMKRVGTRFCVGLALLVGILVPAAACWLWRYGYTSDTAMIGLMAKSILQRGERPLFVWSVGYQGVLLEAYGTALIFKLLGMGPRSLNLFNTLCFWGVLGLLFAHVRRVLDTRVAALAVVFFTLSTPTMIANVLRTQPNYTETYLMGLVLLVIARHAVQRFYVQQQAWAPKDWAWLLAAGTLAGFAMYTYAQIVYFFAAIALQVCLIVARELRAAESPPATRALRWLAVAAAAAGGALMLAGGVALLRDIPEFALFGHTKSPLRHMVTGAAIVGGALLLECLRVWPQLLRRLLLATLGFAVCFVAGYAPALVHRYVLHGKVVTHTSLYGTWQDIAPRLSILGRGLLMHFNIDAARPVTWFWGAGMMAAVLWFLGDLLRRVHVFVRGHGDRASLLRLDALFLLPWVAVPAFLLAGQTVDLFSARYILVLWMVYAVALAWVLVPWAARSGYGRVLVLSLLVMNGLALGEAVDAAESAGFVGEEAVAPLQERGLHYGYADYWLAYNMSFFTREDIVLQPTYTPYCPFYGPLVEGQERIALVDRTDKLQTVHKVYHFGTRVYHPVEVWHGQRVGFVVLQADADANTHEGMGPAARLD